MKNYLRRSDGEKVAAPSAEVLKREPLRGHLGSYLERKAKFVYVQGDVINSKIQ